MRAVAVDWSGDATASGQRSRIWTAVAEDGEITHLVNGLTRQETIDLIIAMADVHEEMAVGLDFAFSYPAWFFPAHGLSAVADLWSAVAIHGESWLRTCQPPFWGRPGAGRPVNGGQWRKTELACESVNGVRPKSVFQVGGAGAVGTGSIRGMPLLLQLREAGFSIWPFATPEWPIAVEIYPRVLTGPVVKRSPAARSRLVDALGLEPAIAERARHSEDAFDAALSALAMCACSDRFQQLPQPRDPVTLLEGEIRSPSVGALESTARALGRPAG